MTMLLGIMGFALLFAAFSFMGPVLMRKMRCGRSAGSGGCGSCAGDSCKYTE
jgi:hypothetical protein